jgi:dienelactone hydrolase
MIISSLYTRRRRCALPRCSGRPDSAIGSDVTLESPAPDATILGRQHVGEVAIEHLAFEGANGARVPAYLFRPRASDGARPAIVLQHGANTSKDDYYIQAPARRWAKEGWTCLAIDLAEHGERIDGVPLEQMARRRLIAKRSFVEQGVGDLQRAIDVLEHTPGVDRTRIGLVGFSLGGMLGTIVTAREARIRAAAVVIAGSFAYTRYWERGDTAEERERRQAAAHATDPAFFAAAIAPRPLLMVNTEDDPVFPREAALALFDAAREPKELRWHPGTHHQWGAGVYKDVWQFFTRHLA